MTICFELSNDDMCLSDIVMRIRIAFRLPVRPEQQLQLWCIPKIPETTEPDHPDASPEPGAPDSKPLLPKEFLTFGNDLQSLVGWNDHVIPEELPDTGRRPECVQPSMSADRTGRRSRRSLHISNLIVSILSLRTVFGLCVSRNYSSKNRAA